MRNTCRLFLFAAVLLGSQLVGPAFAADDDGG
jgi:hypothetical protein